MGLDYKNIKKSAAFTVYIVELTFIEHWKLDRYYCTLEAWQVLLHTGSWAGIIAHWKLDRYYSTMEAGQVL